MSNASRKAPPRRRKAALLALLFVPLLVCLLVLQARWLGDLATAQHEVRSRLLTTAAERMAGECQNLLSALEETVLAGRVQEDTLSAALVAEVVPLEPGATPPLGASPAFIVQDPVRGRQLVVLEVAHLASEVFPALARRALGDDGVSTYHVSVVPTSPNAPVLYRSHPAADTQAPPDASADLTLTPNRWRALFAGADARWTEVDSPTWISDGEVLSGEAFTEQGASWRIELRHRSGSLERALAHARWRNLLLAAGLLALVVAGLTVLWAAEQRGRRLAEREVAFVAGVSHELRTPLTVVRTAASNLARGVVVEAGQVAEYGELIEREATRVSTLVERVLRFSGNGRSVALERVDLERVLRDAVERCEPWRDRKRFEVAIDVAPDARSLQADGAALTSALHNLIENAIKYGPDGQTIRVAARRNGELVIEVADEGPGVDDSDRAHLFDPFYRGARVRGGSIPGSGLGLGVAREIAHAHGGRLELVDDTPPRSGATFTLHLPANEAPGSEGRGGSAS